MKLRRVLSSALIAAVSLVVLVAEPASACGWSGYRGYGYGYYAPRAYGYSYYRPAYLFVLSATVRLWRLLPATRMGVARLGWAWLATVVVNAGFG